MPKKGIKHVQYTDNLKQEVMLKYTNNEGTTNTLSKEYNIPLKTVSNWVLKINKGIDIGKSMHYLKGRRKDENVDYKERYEILKKYQAFLKAQRERK